MPTKAKQLEKSFTRTLNANPRSAAEREEILANPGFGRHFTDHMVRIDWTQDAGWHDARVIPYGPLSIDPATNFMHYGQAIFEGLKAYRHADGSIKTFRPKANAERFQRSAARMAMAQRIADKPEMQHGVHRYSIADYGMSAQEVRSAFGDYVARFDLAEAGR